MIKRKASSALFRPLQILALGLAAFTTFTQAATIWTGPIITYTQPGTDPAQPANQDRLTPNVWLTRGSLFGLFNAKTETAFTPFSSPADTEWANGTTANYASLSYTNWNEWAKVVNSGPPSTVGINAVLHLILEDIYLDVKFTSWPAMGAGTFAYERSTPAPLAPPTLSAPQLSQNAFKFSASTTPGLAYVMETSSNLVNWVALTTNIATSSTMHFTNIFLPDHPQFFRVGQRPAP